MARMLLIWQAYRYRLSATRFRPEGNDHEEKFGFSMRGRHILEGYSFYRSGLSVSSIHGYPAWKVILLFTEQFGDEQERFDCDLFRDVYYREAFTTDVDFLPLLKSTLTTMLTQVPLILIFAMFSALLLNGKIKGRGFFRDIFFLPVIIASGAILKELLQQGPRSCRYSII